MLSQRVEIRHRPDELESRIRFRAGRQDARLVTVTDENHLGRNATHRHYALGLKEFGYALTGLYSPDEQETWDAAQR